MILLLVCIAAIIFVTPVLSEDGVALDELVYKSNFIALLVYSLETLIKVREKIKLRFKDKAIISYVRSFECKR